MGWPATGQQGWRRRPRDCSATRTTSSSSTSGASSWTRSCRACCRWAGLPCERACARNSGNLTTAPHVDAAVHLRLPAAAPRLAAGKLSLATQAPIRKQRMPNPCMRCTRRFRSSPTTRSCARFSALAARPTRAATTCPRESAAGMPARAARSLRQVRCCWQGWRTCLVQRMPLPRAAAGAAACLARQMRVLSWSVHGSSHSRCSSRHRRHRSSHIRRGKACSSSQHRPLHPSFRARLSNCASCSSSRTPLPRQCF